MSASFWNDLKYYCLSVNESPDLAEQKATNFKDKFDKLGKYDQMDIAQLIQTDGWEKAFTSLDV